MIIGGFHKIPTEVLSALQASALEFSKSPIWSRHTNFYFDDVDSSQLQCVVAPINRTLVEGTRQSKAYQYRIAAFVLRQVVENTHAERQTAEDSLLSFVDELQNKLNDLEAITVDDKRLDMIPPSDEQAPYIAEAMRTAKLFIGAAEVDVYDR